MRSGPLSDALRLSRRARGWTLYNLVTRLGRQGIEVSRSALSGWERGEYLPARRSSYDVLLALERLYGYPEGTLASLVPGSPLLLGRGDGNVGPAHDPVAAGHRRLLARIGYRPTHESLVVHETGSVDRDGVPRLRRVRQVVRSTAPATDRHLCILDDPGQLPPGEFRGVENCRAGRHWHARRGRYSVVEVIFDRVLATGETHLFEYERGLRYEGAPPTQVRRRIGATLEHLVMQVRFAPDRVPSRVRWSRWAADDAPPTAVRELTVGTSGSALHVEMDPEPGALVGIHWDW